VYEKL
jgi:hypothetical protein